MEHAARPNASPFKRVRELAIADAEKIAKNAGAAKSPPIAAITGYVEGAFNAAFEAVIKAFAKEELEPFALALLFMQIDECHKRIATYPDKIWTEIWPTTPGYALGGYAGHSALEILRAFTGAVYSALMITFGYSKTNDRFPRDIEEMPVSGPDMTDQFRKWPERAARQLSTRTVAPATVWDFRTEAGKVWSVFLDERDRAERQFLELESMSWLSLLVFSGQATRSWAEHPRYRERTRALEGHLREAAKAAGIVGTDAEDWIVCRNLVDLLVVHRGYTASAAGQVSISDVISLLETGALSRGSLKKDSSQSQTGLTDEPTPLGPPTGTDRKVFRVIRESEKPIKGNVIASALKLNESQVYRACASLVQRQAIQNLGNGRGYIWLMDCLPE